MLGLSAENIGTFLTGLGLALIALLGGRSAKDASAKKQPASTTFELAGAVISDKKADELVRAIDNLSSNVAISTTATREAAASAKEAADAMDVLTREIIRSK